MKAVSFVGSTPVARHVYETATRSGKARAGARRREEPHGRAARRRPRSRGRLRGQCRDSGPRANAAWRSRRSWPSASVADDLVAKIVERVDRLTVGDGRAGADMGPLVTRAHLDRVVSYLDAGVAAGATMVVDGRTRSFAGEASGFWLGPTLFDHVTPDMALYTDEIFGPVLSVLRVDTYDDALALVNANPYGNGTAIFTNDGGAARRFQAEVEVGMVGINVPIPGAGRVLLVRRLEELVVRRHPRARHRRCALLHPHEGGHEPLARPEPRRRRPRVPPQRLVARRRTLARAPRRGMRIWLSRSIRSRSSTPTRT